LGATAWAFYSYAGDFSVAARAREADKAAAAATALVQALEKGDPDELAASRTAANEAVKTATEAEAAATAACVVETIEAVEAGNASAAETAASNAQRAAKGLADAVNNTAVATGGAVVLVSLLVFIASHAFGQGAVIWVFISEIFPNRVRARGQALGSFTHWFMAASISWTFPVIADWSGAYTFAFFAAMMVLQLVWVLAVMPETKGVPLEQIQKRLGIE
jgi:hypothetical protein